jgi:hypothetical protein
MYLFYTTPPLDEWYMVGSATGLVYEAIPARIAGYKRLKWQYAVLFLPDACLKSYGKFPPGDYDVLFQMDGMLYAEVASENGQILTMSDYGMLSRVLRMLVMSRGFFVTDVSERYLRLVSPLRKKPRRASLIMACCGGGEREVDAMTVAMTMQCLGAETSGNGSPVCCVKSAVT